MERNGTEQKRDVIGKKNELGMNDPAEGPRSRNEKQTISNKKEHV